MTEQDTQTWRIAPSAAGRYRVVDSTGDVVAVTQTVPDAYLVAAAPELPLSTKPSTSSHG